MKSDNILIGLILVIVSVSTGLLFGFLEHKRTSELELARRGLGKFELNSKNGQSYFRYKTTGEIHLGLSQD